MPEDGDAWSCAPCIAADNIPYHHLVSLINLRTNSHNLNIERMRHLRPRVPRALRLCPWCRSPEAVHDELHCVLECPHVSPIRLRFPVLFAAGVSADMRTLFTDESCSCALASLVCIGYCDFVTRIGQEWTINSWHCSGKTLDGSLREALPHATSNGCAWPSTDVKLS